MTLQEASQAWYDFMYENLNPRRSQNGWYKIDGRPICRECSRHKNRALYCWYQEEHRPFLKCFRASCDIRRYMTRDDFLEFGFDDEDAINLLIKAKVQHTDNKSWELKTKPIIVQDHTFTRQQMTYFKRRTGMELTPMLAASLRVIPNLAEVIDDSLDPEEDFELYQKYQSMRIPKDKNAITFATRDYRMFSYRHMFRDLKIKYAIEKDYGYTIYRGIPEKTKTLILAEGIFDIINAWNTVLPKQSGLFIASLGASSFLECILYWYRQHCETIEEILFIADSDIRKGSHFHYDEKFYEILLKQMEKKIGLETLKRIIIIYNVKNKDIGDLQYPISIKKVQLWGKD